MNILNRQQVLQKQLKLLNTPGPSLSTYYYFDIEHILFVQPSQSIIYKLLQQYKLIKVKTVPLDVNNIFYVITYVLFNGNVLGEQELAYVLDKLKCTVYADDMDLAGIVGYQYQHKNKQKHKFNSKSKQKQKEEYKNKPCQVLSNKNMKKLLVQFFQIIKYYNGNIQQLLGKYLIVLDILTLFFRTILLEFGIKNAKFYHQQLNKIEVINVIFDYFDILYHVHDSLLIFQNCNYCILLPKDKEVYIGQRDNTRLGSNHLSLEFQEEFGEDQHNDHFGDDNILMGAPTPFFKEISWDQIGTNKLGNIQVAMKQVDEQMNQSNFLKKLQKPLVNQNKLHSDSQVLLDVYKFKTMLDNYTTSPLSPKQTFKNTTKNKGSLKNLQKSDSQNNQNPQQLNIFQIHEYNEDKKQTYSQKASKLTTQKSLQDDFISMRISPRELKLPQKHYKTQSRVIQLKIQSSFSKKYQNTFDQVKTKTMQLKNQLNLSQKIVAKNYGKIPSFLVQKATHGNKSTVSQNLSPLHLNITRRQLKGNKPRVNFTYKSNTNNTYKKPTNLSINQTPIRPTFETCVNSSNYLDHDDKHNNLNISPPIFYRNRNIVRPTIIPKYQQQYHH